MVAQIWYVFFYQPIFNGLFLIYTFVAGYNLGWAVIWLTIFLRIVLLPLTIISERNTLRYKKAVAEAEGALVAYKNDPLAQRNEARKIVKKYKISPWAKVLTLFIQGLVLVLLYQVFIQGISGEKIIKILYPSVQFPGKIDTNFYGFEIGQRFDSLWAGIAAGFLFIVIMLEERRRPSWQKPDIYYVIFFPIITFVVLWYLPMVKSLFILTTMIFSSIISFMSRMFFGSKPKPVVAKH